MTNDNNPWAETITPAPSSTTPPRTVRRAGRSAHHRRSRRHPARPGRQPALPAPGVTTWAQRQSSTGEQPTQDQQVKPPAGGGGEPGPAKFGASPPSGLVTGKPSERALTRGVHNFWGDVA